MPTNVVDAVDKFVKKLRRLRKYLIKWERTKFGVRQKEEELNKAIKDLDIKGEQAQIDEVGMVELKKKRKEFT